jgi:hypothetical protein
MCRKTNIFKPGRSKELIFITWGGYNPRTTKSDYIYSIFNNQIQLLQLYMSTTVSANCQGRSLGGINNLRVT